MTATLLACGRVVVFGQQAAPHFGHALERGAGIFEIAAVRKLFFEFTAHPDGGFDAPGAVGIDAQRIAGAELLAQRADGRDFDIGIQHAAFELDLAEAVFRDHLPAFAHAGPGVEHLAIFVAGRDPVLIEKVGGEADFVAHPPADHVADRLADGLADQIQAGDFDRGEGAGVAVERVFAGNQVGLGAAAGGAVHFVGMLRLSNPCTVPRVGTGPSR